jgi:predicted RNA-binding protein with PIN domain
MSPAFVIIDGYNLLHAAGLARLQYGPGDLERARHRLLALLAEKLRPDERRRCTVVFDAQQAPTDLPRQNDLHGLTIQFAPSGQDADTVIEQIIARHSAPRRMLVVSSDHRLQQAAKRRNAKPVDSEAFLRELGRRESRSPLVEDQVPSNSTTPTSSKALTDWQVEFGDIDVKSLADEVGREPLIDGTLPDSESARLDELQQKLDDPDWLERWLNDSPSDRRGS